MQVACWVGLGVWAYELGRVACARGLAKARGPYSWPD